MCFRLRENTQRVSVWVLLYVAYDRWQTALDNYIFFVTSVPRFDSDDPCSFFSSISTINSQYIHYNTRSIIRQINRFDAHEDYHNQHIPPPDPPEKQPLPPEKHLPKTRCPLPPCFSDLLFTRMIHLTYKLGVFTQYHGVWAHIRLACVHTPQPFTV